jgi:uncharacterized repeat protein (TIGR01451 family)
LSRFVRAVAAMVVVLLCLVVLPGAYTASDDKTDDKAAASAAASPTPSPSSPQPEPTVSPEPTDTPAEPTPTPEVSPSDPASPSTTPSETEPEEPATRERRARALAAALSLSLSAAPEEISVGERTTVTAEVTNTGDEPAPDVHLDVVLPGELLFISATPNEDALQEDPGSTTVGFDFGELAPGESATASVVGEAAGETGEVSQITGTASSEDLVVEDSTSVTVNDAGESALAVQTGSQGLLTPVGNTIVFSVTVSNTGPQPLEEVVVVDIAPREVDVLPPAKLPKGVDAMQVGSSGELQDIVWIIDKLPTGKTLDLSWQGIVDSAGDLAAVNSVTATADNSDKASAQTKAYLAQPGGASTSNPPVEPKTKRIVTRRQVVVRPPIQERPATAPSTPGTTASGETLPFTGVDPSAIALVALGLVMTGIALLVIARRGAQARRLTSVLLLALLIGTACVSNDGDPSAAPEISPRVKGRQIERGDLGNGPEADQDAQDEDSDGGQDPDGTDDRGPADEGDDEGDGDADDTDSPDADSEELPDDLDEDLAGPTSPAPPEVRTVTTVRTVTIGEADLPVVPLTTFSGGDALSFGWNDGSTSITQASSASSAAPNDVARLATSISPSGNGMRVTVTLINPSSSRRLAVEGRLALQVGGEVLRGPGTDVTLNPNGEVSRSFTFRLPSGNYTARPSFSAS